MITHNARRSLSSGNTPVPSPWQATPVVCPAIYVIALGFKAEVIFEFGRPPRSSIADRADVHAG